jgi:hypothetical protein
MSDDDFDLTHALPFDSDSDEPRTPQKLPIPGAPATLGAEFAYIGAGKSLDAFRLYVTSYPFGSVPPDYVVLHHTAIPSATWARFPTGAVWDANEAGLTDQAIYDKRKGQLDKLRDYYRDTKQWPKGPHLFVDDRWIWLFTPMYDVGIHAAQGNSYRDSGQRLHYSIGIEVIGYYEHVHWPPAVAALVAGAVAALRSRLRTFEYIDKPWAGGVGAHRMYNKPQCPGAAIVPSYYLPLLRAAGDGVPPPTPGETRYQVKAAATGGAVIRSGPRTNAARLGLLQAGEHWTGTPIPGQTVSLAGFGSSNLWIKDSKTRYVWSGLLEEIR